MRCMTVILICLFAFATLTKAQGTQNKPNKKPTILVVPDITWAKKKGYIMYQEVNGVKKSQIDYWKAIEDEQFKPLAALMNDMLGEAGYPVENIRTLESVLNKIDKEKILATVYKTGTSLETEIAKVTSIEVFLRLQVSIIEMGPKFQLNVVISPEDATLGSLFCRPVTALSEKLVRTTPFEKLARSAIGTRMEGLIDRLGEEFAKYFEYGRPALLTIRMSQEYIDNYGEDLDDIECGDEDLYEFVEYWLEDNANTFESAIDEDLEKSFRMRIPMTEADGNPISAKQFVRKLEKNIEKYGYKIRSKNRGVAHVLMIIKEKEE